MNILIIEDEYRLAHNIAKGLKAENFSVDIALDGKIGMQMISNGYDLIILDLMLPEVSGLEILKYIRSQKNNTPALILTAKSSVEDKVIGLDIGADDYLAKPFNFTELLARINALIRRSTNSNVILEINSLKLDPKSKHVTRSNKEIILSNTEYRLLEFMMRHHDHILSETELLEHVWDSNYDGLSNVVSVYIRYLRNKIDKPFENETPLIKTIRGLGYKISNA